MVWVGGKNRDLETDNPMRKMKIVWVVCAFVALALVYSGWSTSRAAYETAEYRVIESEGAFEIREYPKLQLVTTSTSFDAQGNDGSFMRLFRFINGENSKQQKVAMTTPVFMGPKREDSAGQMAFVMPMQVSNEGVPEPSSKDVRVKEREAGVFAVARFAGQINEQTIRKEEKGLRQWMATKGYAAMGEVEIAGYDPPWIPGPLRRNEVLLRIKPPAAASKP